MSAWEIAGFVSWAGFAVCGALGLWFLVVMSVHLITRRGRI
jgi:hypothetical protein